ncbi:UDP-3-O-[3-hydroxymyristoyl] glucosamine N-acyltransferase [Saccharicrinis carchari]|uniref:UDP-3-O-acylglucosamine N-acyltransferase n=1 Tax=Saccharicrinis carchari TaxID=1168039 RepID=A0A521F1M6_SACCC|nr:UDP-3-O-(3-hydroxymyristoyl)glucosamine N-acyltransferase [Saccharicrinis carchari]SMO90102.1 UDP-3-O-[3-hydroxymyristoyl] glucosamine N-acyltransferase [Saccharicrinis carchari]
MELSAKQIAELIQGEVVGNPDVTINNVSKIEDGKPGTISFLSNPKYTQYIYQTKASVVIVNNTFEPEKKVSATMIRVPDAYSAVAKLMQMYLDSKPRKTGVEQPSFVSETAIIGDFPYIGAFAYIGENVKIGNNVSIYPNTYIGDNVTIGDNNILYAGVKIYHNCVVGDNCILHAGAVVGSDGFGFAPDENNEYTKIPQLGNVVIEDNCEIGANTALDRATMGSTVLKKGVKLDNFVQIAHNVEIGENTVIAAMSGVAGSTVIGKNCMFGGHAGVVGHLTVADGVKMGAYTGIASSVKKEGAVMRGTPAFEARAFTRSWISLKSLPDLVKEVRVLKQEIKKLKGEE